MDIKSLFYVVCAFAAVSCVREEMNGRYASDILPSEYSVDDNVVRGWVRIKLDGNEMQSLKTGEFTRGGANCGYPDMDALAAQIGAKEIRRVFSDGGKFAERRRRYGFHLWYDVRFDEEIPVSRARSEFASLKGIQHVEPIYKKRLIPTVSVAADAVYIGRAVSEDDLPFNDPMLSQQWHYHSDGSIRGCRTGSDMNLFEGWKTSTGDRSVIVAVTDSGVQYDHEDLAANMWVNDAELYGTQGVDDDDNGYVDDLYGWNYIKDSGTISPEKHGTHVAGTIAAVNGNGIGVCGVAGGSGGESADGARIMTIQIFEGDESTGDVDADGYLYAADNGAVISQNSWNWTSLRSLPKSYSEAFDYFIENAGIDENGNQTGPMRGGIIICAAGNSGGAVEYPAADPRTVTVTAMGTSFNLEPYSNRGPEADIMAPGGVRDDNTGGRRRVLSTSVDNGYDFMYGTSMACPHVAGMAALIIAHYGAGREGFTAQECHDILLRSYTPVGGLVEDNYINQIGVGLLDAGAAFVDDPGVAPDAVTSPTAAAELNVVKLSWTAPADANGNAVASFLVQGSALSQGDNIEGNFRNFRKPGDRVEYAITAQYNTDYNIDVISVDRFGNRSAAARVAVSVGDFENRAPQRSDEKLADVTIPDTSSESIVKIELGRYFTDPDQEYGDALQYSAVSSKESVVGVAVEDDVMILTPLAAGTSLITVTASDKAGATANATLYARVASGGLSPSPRGISVYPSPAAEVLNIRLVGTAAEIADVKIYDSGARKAVDTTAAVSGGSFQLNVGNLVPGIYSLTVTCAEQTFKTTFTKG